MALAKKKKTERRKTVKQAFKEVGIPKPPHTHTVLLDSLQVDGNYQRIPDEKRVARYAADFDPVLCNVLILNERESGTMFIIDGNHRRLILQTVGCTHWQAYIAKGLTSEQEARKYKAINSDRKNATVAEKFKARLHYQDPIACAIKAICRVKGFAIVLENSGRRNGRQIYAIDALELIYRSANRPGLEMTLEVIARSWEKEERSATDSLVLKGIHRVLYNRVWKERICVDHLVKRLQRIQVTKLIRRARGFLDTQAGGTTALFADAVVVENNRRLSKKSPKYLPPRTLNETFSD